MLHTSARFWNRLYRAEWSGRRRMGLWGVLWEILKAVGPHAAPHVARAVRDRQTSGIAERRAQAAAKEIAQGFATMEERLAAAEEKAAAAETSAAVAEERAAAAEDRLAQAQAQIVEQWNAVRKWMLALLVWNAVLTAILIYVLVARR
jgi:hypothetical protein